MKKLITFFVFLLFYLNSFELFAQGSYGGTFYLSTNSDPKSFNPIVAQETSTTIITSLMFEGLTAVDGVTGEVIPCLALDWIVSSDGLSVVFNLRPEVKWFDGTPFTAEDVLFTFQQLIYNPDIVNSAVDIFKVDGKQFEVEKLGDLKVKFILPCKFAPFIRSMSQPILPKHILENAVNSKTFSSCWGIDALPSTIVGTGPFKLEKYEVGQQVVLVKNNVYWKQDIQGNKLPFLDRIVFSIVKNEDVAFLQFKEHNLDYYAMRGSDFPILKPEEEKGNFTIFKLGPALGSNFLSFNLNEGINQNTGLSFVDPKKLSWFKNETFRKAVAYAIDRDSIIDIIFNGLGYLQYSGISESVSLFYNENISKYSYDLAKANSLLKSIGFLDTNQDGVLEDSLGNFLEFNLFVNANSTTSVAMAELIISDLKRLKFKVNLVPLEFNSLVVKLTSSYDWDMVLLGFSGVMDPHFGANVWLSSGGLHFWSPRQSKPQTAWEERIDAIFVEAAKELDAAKRKKLYDEWQQIISDKLPLIYLTVPETIVAIANKFGNLKPTLLGGALHNIEEIYVLDNEHK